MTKFLTELITDKTDVLELKRNYFISEKKKISVMGLDSYPSTFLKKYISYIYYKKHIWYFFLKDLEDCSYPFYIIDELMGYYLARKRNLASVEYQIAKTKDEYGIASINFKSDKYEYFTFANLYKNMNNINCGYSKNIKGLLKLCINPENEKLLLSHLFQMFAMDIYMLQRDRCDINLQFQKNKKTKEFDLAPIYDFSSCLSKMDMDDLETIENIIVDLNEETIPLLAEEFPKFKEELLFFLDQNMIDVWNEICLDYQLNQDCLAYEKIKRHYKLKDKSSKKYIRKLIYN